MRQIKIEMLDRHFSIEFNVVNNWFRSHLDPLNETVGEFLKINEKFPIGPLRDRAYNDLAIEKIRAAGLYDKFVGETKQIIEEATKLWNDYDAFLSGLGVRNAQVCNAAAAVVDARSLEHFKHVCEAREELGSGPGPTAKPSLHWLREQIAAHKGQQHKLEGTGQTYTFLTKEEILDFIDEAIRRP